MDAANVTVDVAPPVPAMRIYRAAGRISRRMDSKCAIDPPDDAADNAADQTTDGTGRLRAHIRAVRHAVGHALRVRGQWKRQ